MAYPSTIKRYQTENGSAAASLSDLLRTRDYMSQPFPYGRRKMSKLKAGSKRTKTHFGYAKKEREEVIHAD
jgi:hypothetical protein